MMDLRGVLTILILTLCSGCELIIGTLPKPDNFWNAAVTSNVGFRCASAGEKPVDCVTKYQAFVTENVRTYLRTKFPIDREQFVSYLNQEHFVCSVAFDAPLSVSTIFRRQCIYSASQTAMPCVVTSRVSIALSFIDLPNQKTQIISARDVDVSAMAVPDYGTVDNRGCFPL
jgi:hypothetical protein